jgi:hypothetical protein
VLSTNAGCATPHRRHRRLRPQRGGGCGANGAASRPFWFVRSPRCARETCPMMTMHGCIPHLGASGAQLCQGACEPGACVATSWSAAKWGVHVRALACTSVATSWPAANWGVHVRALACTTFCLPGLCGQQLWIAEGNHPDGHQAGRISWVRPMSTLVSLSSASCRARPASVYVKIGCANFKRACCASTERSR